MRLTQEILQETFQHMYYANETRNINLRHETHALTLEVRCFEKTMDDLLKLRSADISIMLQSLYLITKIAV